MLPSVDPAADHSRAGVRLADHTTLRLGGPASDFVVARTERELIDAVTTADAAGTSLLVLGGGSNLVVADEGFAGTVVRVATRGLSFEPDDENPGRFVVRAAAGEIWDQVVAAAIERGLAGIESLSGIPGLVGATPIQNVGAYGTELSDVVTAVRVFDRVQCALVTLDATACGFGYRTSALKGHDRYVVLEVEISLTASANSSPVRYVELARRLGVELGATAPVHDVRAEVLELRAAKGMLVDPADLDSVSAGSFFTNPILEPSEVPEGAPAWPTPDGRVKTSAAWLIERAGFTRGHNAGTVGLSSKHTLALVNRGGASSSELIALARTIRDGVHDTFGISLDVEPVLVGLRL
ncbi:MAG: UDP-N-acetylmuramate dehydrogenase [Acidothermaceae bacterium]